MDTHAIRVVAMDLDGTLTQHKSPLGEENRAALDRLRGRYRLLMAGAGRCERISAQMGAYPVDIIGNYGLQYAKFDEKTGKPEVVFDRRLPCDRLAVLDTIARLRRQLGLTSLTGDAAEFHSSGCVTFPLLGTRAPLADKLACDPDRSVRRRMYPAVVAAFPEYRVFIGGSSSFDMAPIPYDKRHALEEYCKAEGLAHESVVYIGDDYGPGGNDEAVFRSDFPFIPVDDYRRFPQAADLLLAN